ncbi:unnamed protein product [Rotaria magnacalcarata]
MPRDKLHRRNPLTVRQEVQSFNNVILDATLPDIELNEMPGLQNPEEWKRIATRNILMTSPLSHEYHQNAASVIEIPDGEKQGVFTVNYQSESRRQLLFCAAIVLILMTVIVSVVVTVVLVRKPDEIITNYYSGSVFVDANFDPVLASISSILSKNYQLEFCSLISTTLTNLKTKYAVFYASCTLNNFRNGSIVGDFVLGFTRYQNVTRLNTFLNRTINYKQLFGGTVRSIVFNNTKEMDRNNTQHASSYGATSPTPLVGFGNGGRSTTVTSALSKRAIIQHSNDRKLQITYSTTDKAGLTSESILTNALPLNADQYKRSKRLEHYASPKQLLLPQQDYHMHQPSFSDNSSISLTTVSPRSSSLNSLEDSWSEDRVDKFVNLAPVSSNKNLAISNAKTKYFSTSDDSLNTVESRKPYIAEHIPLRDDSSSTSIHPTSKNMTSNNLSYRNSTQQLLHMSLLSNGRTQKAVDELPYITQDWINRSLLQNKSNTHHSKQSSNHLSVEPITNKKRTMKHNHSSNIGQQNQALDNKNKTIKYKILNLLRFIR